MGRLSRAERTQTSDQTMPINGRGDIRVMGVNQNNAVLVYQRKDDQSKVRAEYIDTARTYEDDDRWEHIATLEPRAYINAILVDFPELVDRLKGGE